MSPTDDRIGFVGLGRMGARIAANLAAVGYRLTVWNRTRTVARDWVSVHGGAVADSLADLAGANDVVITMLADGSVLEEVYHSERGLLEALRPTTVAIDMGTSGPNAFRTVQERVENQGATMVDAPVSGSIAAAEAATLLIMVGAPPEMYKRVEPVMAAVGRPVNVGAAGSASVLKLAVNSVLYGLNQAVAEAIALAEAGGVEPEVTLDVLTQGAAGAPMLDYRREQYLNPDEAPISFTLDLVLKDLALAIDQARSEGVPTRQLERTQELAQGLVTEGFGDRDMGYVVRAARQRSH